MTGKPNQKHRQIAASRRAILAERFPRCFMGKGCAKLPLKIGISGDLAAACPEIPEAHIRIAMRDYCGGAKYLRAMLENERRVALDGSDAGFVSRESAAFALLTLERLNAWRAARQREVAA